MPRPSRFDRINRPSPLHTVEYARPLSTLSSLNHTPDNAGGDGRRLSVLPEQMAPDDAEFWQRFDVAARGIAMDEGMSRSPSREGRRSPATEGSDQKSRNEWLEKQRRKRRRAHLMAWSIGLSICSVIVAVAVIGWYFGNNKRKPENDIPSTNN